MKEGLFMADIKEGFVDMVGNISLIKLNKMI